MKSKMVKVLFVSVLTIASCVFLLFPKENDTVAIYSSWKCVYNDYGPTYVGQAGQAKAAAGARAHQSQFGHTSWSYWW